MNLAGWLVLGLLVGGVARVVAQEWDRRRVGRRLRRVAEDPSHLETPEERMDRRIEEGKKRPPSPKGWGGGL